MASAPRDRHLMICSIVFKEAQRIFVQDLEERIIVTILSNSSSDYPQKYRILCLPQPGPHRISIEEILPQQRATVTDSKSWPEVRSMNIEKQRR